MENQTMKMRMMWLGSGDCYGWRRNRYNNKEEEEEGVSVAVPGESIHNPLSLTNKNKSVGKRNKMMKRIYLFLFGNNGHNDEKMHGSEASEIDMDEDSEQYTNGEDNHDIESPSSKHKRTFSRLLYQSPPPSLKENVDEEEKESGHSIRNDFLHMLHKNHSSQQELSSNSILSQTTASTTKTKYHNQDDDVSIFEEQQRPRLPSELVATDLMKRHSDVHRMKRIKAEVVAGKSSTLVSKVMKNFHIKDLLQVPIKVPPGLGFNTLIDGENTFVVFEDGAEPGDWAKLLRSRNESFSSV